MTAKTPAKSSPGRWPALPSPRSRQQAAEALEHEVGGGLGRGRLLARRRAAEDEDRLQPGSPSRRRCRRRPGRRSSPREGCAVPLACYPGQRNHATPRSPSRTGAAPACPRSRPAGPRRSRPPPAPLRSRAARRRDRASSGRGWWRRGRRRVPAPASPSAAPRSRSRGGRRRRPPSPPRRRSPSSSRAPVAATISFSAAAPITKAPPPWPAASPASWATTTPAVTICSAPTSTPICRSRSA